MHQLSDILSTATGAVSDAYFTVSIDGGDPVLRERVYCYELYHQMRCLWPVGVQYVLTGELDKSSHPILQNLSADHAKPDFLIHTPGSMAGNYAIIEVKHSTALDRIRKDLDTLSLFVRKVGYQRAIYLFYGWGVGGGTVERIKAAALGCQQLVPIEIWLHSRVGQQATHHTTID